MKDMDVGPCEGAESEFELSFLATVPAATGATRSLSSTEEDALNEVDILVFSSAGTRFAYRTYGVVDPDASGQLSRIRAKVIPTTGSDTHTFVLLGNLRSEVNELFAGQAEGYFVGRTKSQVLTPLLYKVYESAAGQTDADRMARRWDTATPRYLPMWGETAPYRITSSNDITVINNSSPVRMLRSVAKIDISFDEQKTRDNFLLTKVMVYNATMEGRIVPDESNLTDDGTKIVARKPTLLTGTPTREMILHEIQKPGDITGSTDPARIYDLTNSIYVSEFRNTALNGTAVAQSERMALIVGGIYDETGTGDFTTAPETWYRLDFYWKETLSSPSAIINILRNHKYHFKIGRIDGPGYLDPEDAIKSDAINIDDSVLDWEDDFNTEEVYYDGHYMFSTSPRNITIIGEGTLDDDYVFYAQTNSPVYKNIKFAVEEVDSYGNFFTTQPYEYSTSTPTIDGKPGERTEIAFAMGENKDGPDGRQIKIIIWFEDDAGNKTMQMPVLITQKRLDFWVDEIYFYYDPDALENQNIYSRFAWVFANGHFERLYIQSYLSTYDAPLDKHLHHINAVGTLDPELNLFTQITGETDITHGYFRLDPVNIIADQYGSAKLSLPVFGDRNFQPADLYTPVSFFQCSATISLGNSPFGYSLRYSFDLVNWFDAPSEYYHNHSTSAIWHLTHESFKNYTLQLCYPSNEIDGAEQIVPQAGGYWRVRIMGIWSDETPVLLVVKTDDGEEVGRLSVPNPGRLMNSSGNPVLGYDNDIPITVANPHNYPRNLNLWYSIRGDGSDLRPFANEKLNTSTTAGRYGSMEYYPVTQAGI